MKQTIKKLFAEYIKTIGKGKFILFLFSAFLVSLLSIIQPLFLAKIISQIELFLKNGTFDDISFYHVLAFWIISALVYTIFSFIYRYYFIDLSCLKNYCRIFNSKILDVFSMNYSEFLGKKTGSIYKNFDRGSEVQFGFMFFIFKDFLPAVFSIFIAVFILFFINIKMSFISLSMLPIMIFLGVYLNKKTSKKQRDLNKKWDFIFGEVGDFMGNFLLSKTLFLEKKFGNNLKKEVNEQYERQKFVSKGWSILDVYTSTLIYISRILVLGFGTYFIINGTLEFSILFLFLYYIGFIYFPLSFIFGSFERIQKLVSEAERYYYEFENIEVEKLNSGKNIKKLDGNIEFKNVEFSYNKDKKIFRKLNFSIKKGEKIAFVGNTGAGKSTIINLIFRLWDINFGEILLDNKNINSISKKSIRKNIGIVTQDVSLYNDTLKNNLLYANSKATNKDLEKALKTAEANFALKLKDGLETIIGERGMKLSGGEKQRIAIARLFIKNPEILILDEATSALDNKTEKLVQKALDKLMKGKTSIIIAHRLSTIQNVDKIYMLENGEIIETGTYQELINKGGKFAELANPKNLIIN